MGKAATHSEYQGGEAKVITDIEFPAVGERDADIFENNLLEVMRFVFSHTTFDPDDEIDQKLLAACEPIGVVPGRAYDPTKVPKIDGKRFRRDAERIWSEEMAKGTCLRGFTGFADGGRGFPWHPGCSPPGRERYFLQEKTNRMPGEWGTRFSTYFFPGLRSGG